MNSWPTPPTQLLPLIDNLEQVTRTGLNQWQARCPNPDHLDTNPSFGFRTGDRKPVVTNCQRGCSWPAIQAGLNQRGIDSAQIRHETTAETPKPRKSPLAVTQAELEKFVWFRSSPSSDLALTLHEFLSEERGLDLDTVLAYGLGFNSRDGRIAVPVHRDGKVVNVRQYKPHARDAEKKFIQTTGHGQSILFGLDGLVITRAPVLFTEGELDAMLANQNSGGAFVAVSGTGGASVPPSDLAELSGREVFIAYDTDEGGDVGAAKLHKRLTDLGITTRILDLKRLGLPWTEKKGQDLTDFYVNHGGTTARLLAEFARLRTGSNASDRVIVRRASAIRSRRQRFLWENRMPVGTITLFAGSGGVGKSTFALWLAVELQYGRLPGDMLGKQTPILYVSVEDDWETVMKPRLTGLGADMDLMYQLAIQTGTDETTGERYPLLPDDLPRIREAVEQTGAGMVIFDPITSTIQGDDHKRADVRAVLDPLAHLAGELDVAIVGIMHFKKGAGDVSDKVSGSHAFRDTARALMLFAKDDDTGHVVMTQDKGNYADYGDSSLAYRLIDTVVELDDGDVAHVAKVEIVGPTSTSVSQLVNRTPVDDELVQWLSDYMASVGNRVLATEAEEAYKDAGFSKSAVTRARKRARPPVESSKLPGMGNGFEWSRDESALRSEGLRGGVISLSAVRERFHPEGSPDETEAAGTEETAPPDEAAPLLTKRRRNRSRSPRGSSANSS